MKIYIAPMAGFTDYSYRKILCRFDPDLLFCEMVNAHLVKMGNRETEDLLKCDSLEKTGAQIFGGNKDEIIYSFLKLEEMGFKNINFNMGCPQNKIIKGGAGCALLPRISFVDSLMCELRELLNSDTKISIKIRLGYKDFNSPEVYIGMGDKYNLDFICVHGRTREQIYSGVSDWGRISFLSKIERNISFIGNGDLFEAEDIKNKIGNSALDGIMLARGIIGNPWLISQVREFLLYGEIRTVPDFYTVKNTLIEHMNLLIENKGEMKASMEINKFIKPYFQRFQNNGDNDLTEKLREITVEKNVYKKMKEISGL